MKAIPSLKGSDIATGGQENEHTKMLERENKARQDLEKLVEGLVVE